MSKLKAFGIGDPLLKWFQSYLTESKQRVLVNGTYSAWTDVGSGVPQGSLLGPILFLLFVNDMPRVVENAKLSMFDSKCFKVIYQESDGVSSLCHVVSPLRDVVSSLYDVVLSLCDVVLPLCDVVSSLCDVVSPLCDVLSSLCDVLSSLCDVVLSLSEHRYLDAYMALFHEGYAKK